MFFSVFLLLFTFPGVQTKIQYRYVHNINWNQIKKLVNFSKKIHALRKRATCKYFYARNYGREQRGGNTITQTLTKRDPAFGRSARPVQISNANSKFKSDSDMCIKKGKSKKGLHWISNSESLIPYMVSPCSIFKFYCSNFQCCFADVFAKW